MTAKDEGRSLRRFGNLLREAHRSAMVTPYIYPAVFMLVTLVYTPFFVVEPHVFDHPDHV